MKKAMFIISIDVDVGCKSLGVTNKGKNDANVNYYFSERQIGKTEEIALPLFIDLFEKTNVPATFAVRGQLAEEHGEMVGRIKDSTVQHDIGSHGYTHRRFTTLSPPEAELEVKKTSAALKKIGVSPKSFIFPRNDVGYLDILENYNYKCYRSSGGGIACDCMRIERHGALFELYPSMLLDQNTDLFIMKRFLDVTLTKKGPLHFWFHMWNFGRDEKSLRNNINRILTPLLEYAKTKENAGLLSFETMFSAVNEIERSTLF